MDSTLPLLNLSNPEGLREIQTARSIDAMNEAVRNGFWPLVKPVEPSPEIHSTYRVFQNRVTGEFIQVADPKRWHEISDEYDLVLMGSYYPYQFASPFAAYLVPADIQQGERVFLTDLIEDHVGLVFHGVYRMRSCEATWNGKDFDIHYDVGHRRTGYAVG